MSQHAHLPAVVGFVHDHISKHSRARSPRPGPTIAMKFCVAAPWSESLGQHLRAQRRTRRQGAYDLLLRAAGAIEPGRPLQVRRRQAKPLAANVMNMGKDRGDIASLAAGKLRSPCPRVEILEQELVDAVVDRVCLIDALAQI